MNIVFFGSSSFSVPPLKSISPYVSLVVTKKGKPKGRGYTLDDNEVKRAAIEMELPLMEIESFKDETAQGFQVFKPDLFVVASFGLIFPKWALDLPAIGAINIHPSMLPKYRGPSPIQWAILNGEERTGVTIMKMVEKMDAGNIVYQEDAEIVRDDNMIKLSEKLSKRAAEILPEIIDRINIQGLMEGINQKDEDATYTPIIKKEMGKIDWDKKAIEIVRQIKAFVLWPTAYTSLDNILFKIFDGEINALNRKGIPGMILGKNKEGILVSTIDGSILIKEIQLENRKKMNAYEFANGYRGLIGKVLNNFKD
ncbi:MAG: methionyl-tRNA formyltransferase [Proteobacteria bacterium]|nr:methionyl-tRNA formyltransferase [Pseudomonadota bacterium]